MREKVQKLDDSIYRALLDLFMCSDPWPVDPDCDSEEIVQKLLDDEAKARGFTGWVVAYHELKR